MSNDLVKLYKDLTGKESGAEVKTKIENELHSQMREHFLQLMGIGNILGYDKLRDEMKAALDLLEQLKRK